MRAQIIFFIIGLTAVPGVAAAQEGRGPSGSRVEVGAEVGAVHVLPAYGAHLSVAVFAGHSVELVGSAMPYIPWEDDANYFVGQAQWRATVNRRPGWQLFVTAGGTVTFHNDHQREYRFTRPDGSVFVRPESRSWELEAPVGFHVGIGGQHALRGRTAIRWDAQGIVHVGGGVVPIGRATVSVVRLLGRTQ